MLFDEKKVIIFSKTLEALAIGYRNPQNRLYEIPLPGAPLVRDAPPPRVETAPSPRVNSTHEACGAYEMKTGPKIMGWMHNSMGFPVKETIVKAVENNNLVTIPALRRETVLKYMENSDT